MGCTPQNPWGRCLILQQAEGTSDTGVGQPGLPDTAWQVQSGEGLMLGPLTCPSQSVSGAQVPLTQLTSLLELCARCPELRGLVCGPLAGGVSPTRAALHPSAEQAPPTPHTAASRPVEPEPRRRKG